MKTLTVYTKSQCTFICESVSFAGDQAVLKLDQGRGVKLYLIREILLIEPTE